MRERNVHVVSVGSSNGSARCEEDGRDARPRCRRNARIVIVSGLVALTVALMMPTVVVSGDPPPREARPVAQTSNKVDLAAKAANDLRARFPGVGMRRWGPNQVSIFGRAMTEAQTPTAAAEKWMSEHADVLGVADVDLREVEGMYRRDNINIPRISVFPYRQYIDGLPVENSRIRLTVVHDSTSRVVSVGGSLIAPPAEGFQRDTVDAATAVATVRKVAAYSGLVEWSTPEMVVFFEEAGEQTKAPVRAWKFRGTDLKGDNREAYTFFVDAASGELVHARDDVHYNGTVSGNVQGWATPGTLPDISTNPEVLMDLPGLRVQLDTTEACEPVACDGDWDVTDADGDYSVYFGDTGTVDVVADLQGLPSCTPAGPPWFEVSDSSPLAECSESEDPSQNPTVDFTFNSSKTAYGTAQVNAVLHANRARDFVLDRAGGSYTALDYSILLKVNSGSVGCNAVYTAPSVLEFGVQGGCVNPAYSTIVAHEYGHNVHYRESLPATINEGFADAFSVLVHNTPKLGESHWVGDSGSLRDYECPPVLYPCADDGATVPLCNTEYFEHAPAYGCGKLLAGVWWDIKLEMQDSLGSSTGLEYTRQLFVDWLTNDVSYESSSQYINTASGKTLHEVLKADDIEYGDGEVANGAPHEDEICAAFATHCIFDAECEGTCYDCPDPTQAANPIYVDVDATEGDNDGTSWANAYTDLRTGVSQACYAEVWVKEGTYYLNFSLYLRNNVAIYGGFDGSESDASDSDPINNVTNIVPANVGFPPDHLVESKYNDETAVLRGFHIKDGNAGGTATFSRGGGLRLVDSDPTIVQCVFEDNDADDKGGAVYVASTSAPTFVNCEFAGNKDLDSSGTIARGGAVYVENGNPQFHNCLFWDNEAEDGGAVYVGTGAPKFVNCTIANNDADDGSSTGQGGAIWDGDGTAVVENSILWDNDAHGGSGDQIYNSGSTTTDVCYSDVEGTWPNGTNCTKSNKSKDPKFSTGAGVYTLIASPPESKSPCIDAGDNDYLPDDVGDLDWDDITAEELPKDLRTPATFDKRKGGLECTVDMGAYEDQNQCYYP